MQLYENMRNIGISQQIKGHNSRMECVKSPNSNFPCLLWPQYFYINVK